MAELPSADELIGSLSALGVHLLAGGESFAASPLPPARLLAALAEQTDARLRLAIIPLLLCRPEFAPAAPEAAAHLTEPGRTTLKLFYTAAVPVVNPNLTVREEEVVLPRFKAAFESARAKADLEARRRQQERVGWLMDQQGRIAEEALCTQA